MHKPTGNSHGAESRTSRKGALSRETRIALGDGKHSVRQTPSAKIAALLGRCKFGDKRPLHHREQED